MADQGYRRPRRQLFDHVGINVNSPIDVPRQRRLYKCKNITVEIDGSLTTRPGCASLYAGLVLGGITPCHSVRRIGDDEAGTWARIIGTGTRLAVETSAAPGTTTEIDTGYSGHPLTFASFRPTESAKLHVYVGDDWRMRKVDTTGVDKQIGLPPPVNPPTVELGRPFAKEVSDMRTAAAWANAGVAGAVAAIAGGRVNTSLEATSGSIYDTGSSGWACFRPLSILNIGPGSLLSLVNGLDVETVRVAEVHRAGSATTIGSIIYESGTTGICTIQPTNGVEEFTRNAVVRLVNGGTTEYARVLSTVLGVNGNRCIRLRTTANFVAGNAIQVVNSFRAYTITTFPSSSAVSYAAVQSTSSASGTMQMTDTVNVDLTLVSVFSGTNEVPMTDNDYLTLGLKVSNLSKITNVRVMFSLDSGAFASNYYYYTIEQSVLVAAAKNTQTAAEIRRRERQQRQSLIQDRRELIRQGNADVTAIGARLERRENFTPPDVNWRTDVGFNDSDPDPIKPIGETGTGDDQWFDVSFRRGRCERVGSEQGKGWKDIDAVRIEVTVTATGVIVGYNSLNASGGYEPDVGDVDVSYQYRYRGRDSSTGVVSDYSPECLEEITPLREQVVVSMTQHPSPEVDKLDIERWGGTQPQWLLVGTVDNTATPSYTDKLSDQAALSNSDYSDQRVLQPWVRYSSASKSGTASIVAGNLVRDDGTSPINTDIVPGTRIIVGGVATSIRRVIDNIRWEVAHSLGSATNVKWEIPVEVRAGRPLGAIWRHDAGEVPVLFACDGIYLRWSIGKNPDGTRARNVLEVTESNDPLIMGFSHNGRCGVFTTERLFWITGDPLNGFRADHVPDSDGLYSRWALAVGKKYGLTWLSKSRINISRGGTPKDATSDDLSALFANEEGGGAPTTVNGVRAPKIASSEADYLRMDFADDGSVMFFYRDLSANRGCLRYSPVREGWFPYEYAKNLGFVYAEEGKGVRSLLAGGDDGKLYLVGGSAAPSTDDGTGFAFELLPFAENFGDARPNKRIGDLEVDVNPNNQTINVEIGYNNHTTTTNLGTITGASQVQRLFDLSSGDGVRARNVSLRLHGTTIAGSRPKFFSWEPSVMEYPADTILRAAAWHDAGYAGEKYMKGVRIHSDTYNLVKAVRAEKDGGVLIESFNLQHNGERRETILFATPVKANLVRLATVDTDPWTLIDWEWIYDKDISKDLRLWTDAGYDNDKYMQAVILQADTFNVAKTLQIQKDGGTVIDTITLTHNGERRETYAFDVTSDALRIARLLRIVESDTSISWSLIDVEWVFNRESAAAKVWEIQYTGVDARDYFHVFQILLTLTSSASTTMETWVDGVLVATDTITSTSGVMDKTDPIVMPAIKGKLWKWRLESAADIRLYQRDCAIWVMEYASAGDYQILKPFGGQHRDRGAEA